ncbi:ATP-grasp domain-containing protein [Bdellovibrio sp. HCB337]|uniref:D-alanine--D-alanine ligase family protein n=1 Tax=Bdellovibrio sp. HCB337 TaxID=3394358 RepID=UPI0039A4789B
MKKSLLLFGGSSEERLVSVASAQNLAVRYEFSEIYFIHPEGSLSSISKDELLNHKDAFQVQFRTQQKPFSQSLNEAISFLKDKTVFLALHGTQGEDGTIQSLFESASIAFTGSNSTSSRLAFEKDKAKKVVSKVDIAVAAEMVLNQENLKNAASTIQAFYKQHGKMVVKPIANGSSIGLHIIADEKSLNEATQAIGSEKYGSYLLEKFIEGRELTIGVLETDQGLKALPPSEVVLNAGHSFDYQGKYLGRGTTEITPAILSASETEKAQHLAIQAHKALGCFGYSRTDVILTSTGPVFLETNTLPGLSKASFIPQQLTAANIEFKLFIERQLELAETRKLT